MKYDNILNNSEFESFMAKVKVTVAIFRKKKHCDGSSNFIYILILILYHTNV